MTNRISFLMIAVLLLLGLTVQTRAQSVSLAMAQPEASASELYACPMHGDVSSSKPGKCSKCGMELKAASADIAEEFIVRTETEPKRLQPGQKTTLRFTIFNPRTGEQVKAFNIQHEKPFHLFIVSSDLKHFDHIHPTQEPNGSFTIDTILPQAGLYHVFCDIFPAGGIAQVVHQNLVTDAFKANAESVQARLQPEAETSKTVDGLRVEMKCAPEMLRSDQPTLLRFQLTDTKTGQPITDLQPYLGAWGHTLILSEDAADYLHSHPINTQVQDAAPSTIYFETYFPRPGKYKIWSQFQRNNKIITVSFTVAVANPN
ncbi:MAG: hypothetical protein JST84_17690 [Acidobacteria bacterium]|nr:hypothetical protein [Acidobacteriota bacterium]